MAVTEMRRTKLIAIHWLSIPMAAFVIIAPVRSAVDLAGRYSRMFHTDALILESNLTRAGSRGIGAQFELYVRYPVEDGRKVESTLTVMGDTFRSLRPETKIGVFVDPKTHRAEDDLRLDSYFMIGMGAAGGLLLFFVGFYATGRVLRTLNQN